MKEKLKRHFSLIVLSLSIVLLGLGFYYLDKRIVISIISASMLLFFMISFYLVYFSKYRHIIDAVEPNEFYFSPCRLNRIVVQSVLFVGVFTLISAVIDALSPEFGFQQMGVVAILSVFVQSILDGLSFGLLSKFDWQIAQAKVTSPLALSLIYVATLVICLGLYAALFARIKEKFDAAKLVDELVHGEPLSQTSFNKMNVSKLKGITKKIKTGEIDLDLYGEDIVLLLMNNTSKPARTLFLVIMQQSDNQALFTACLDYFVTAKDRRFKAVCESIASEQKRSLLHLRGLVDDVQPKSTTDKVKPTTSAKGKKNKPATQSENKTDTPKQADSAQANTDAAPASTVEPLAETELYDEPPTMSANPPAKKNQRNKNRKRKKNKNKHAKQSDDSVLVEV